MKFYKNNIIISKKYLDDCIIEGPDQKLIIIFTDYKSSFFAHNIKKIWTLNGQGILQPKKNIIIFDFLLS